MVAVDRRASSTCMFIITISTVKVVLQACTTERLPQLVPHSYASDKSYRSTSISTALMQARKEAVAAVLVVAMVIVAHA